MATMQAIQLAEKGAPNKFELATVPIPTIASPYDILVKIKGVALNPIDTKLAHGAPKGRILGFDASGIVEEAGDQALFKKGDAVLYAGNIGRAGSNAQYQLVDSRIVGRKPESLDWDEAAALPLVGLTAWEMYTEKFKLQPFSDNSEEVLVIVNGAGGAGSMAINLAKQVFGIKTIIATASRPETIEWVKTLGATHVINHREPLAPQIKALNLVPTLNFITYDTPHYLKELIPVTRAYGQFGSIVESDAPVPIHDSAAMIHAHSFHWEFMFSKSMFGYNLESQGRILDQIAKLRADNKIVSHVKTRRVLSAKTLEECHELQSSKTSLGKTVLTVPDELS
jgi:zinc-binding alcohol dehydrogenase family protein